MASLGITVRLLLILASSVSQGLWNAVKDPFYENLNFSNCRAKTAVREFGSKFVFRACLRVWNISDQKLVSLRTCVHGRLGAAYNGYRRHCDWDISLPV